MENQNLVESVLVGDSEKAFESFNSIIAEKLADALEVRKVQIASGIMAEEAEQVDEARTRGGPVGSLRMRRAAARRAAKNKPENSEVKEPNYSTFDWKTKKFKEEVEQMEEAKESHVEVIDNAFNRENYKNLIGKKYPKSKAPSYVRVKEVTKGASKKANEEVEQIDELSKDLLRRYGSEALRQHLTAKAGGDTETADKRARGVNLASAKLNPGQYKNSPDKAKVPATNEEVEQIDEAQLSDAQKLAMMKDPHKAAVLSAMKRYQTVGGDINKLSTAHRTLVANYLAKSGGLDNTTRSAAMAALKNQAAPKTDKM